MLIARTLFITAGLVAGNLAPAPTRVAPSRAVLRVTSGVPGREVRFRGVLLVPGEPMRVIEQTTPYELRATDDLVLGAFEPEVAGPMLRLEWISDFPVPAVITSPRVMVGRRVGGVATEFVQGY
jgi:hypothetical protein